MTALAPHLSAYLREHLPRERAVSPHTVKTYANCFVLLVQFAAARLKRRPTDLEVEDLGTDMIMAFLDHVEIGRGSCVRTRNGRLAAIRSFFRYIEYRIPACLDQALRVRAIPTKKTDKALIDYLDRAEIKALLDTPDPRTRLGTRDRAMLHLTYAGGLRVSELVTLQLGDFPPCPPCTSWAKGDVNGSCRCGRRPRSHCAHGLRSGLKLRSPRFSSMPTGSR